MASKNQNIIVGLFVLLGLAVMGGLIVVFGGGKTVFVKTYRLDAVFPEGVSSVQGGQTVTLNGKRIGETRGLRFVEVAHPEKGVVVEITIEDIELPAAGRLVVAPPAMGLGKPLIAFEVLDSADTRRLPMDGKAAIPGEMRPAIDQLVPKDMQGRLITAFTRIGELADSLKPVAQNLDRLLDARKTADVDNQSTTANLDSAIQRLDAVLKGFQTIIGDQINQKNFADLLANANKISETGVTAMQNISDASAHSKQVMTDTSGLLRKLTGLADDMSSVMKNMDSVVLAMNQKSGTIGLMLNDNRLYEELLLTARRMTKLMDDFREVADLAKKGQLRIKAF